MDSGWLPAIAIASAGGIAATITGLFTLKISNDTKNLRAKVGNGWTEGLGMTLDKIQQSADHNGSEISELKGAFNQHVTQHQWKDKE